MHNEIKHAIASLRLNRTCVVKIVRASFNEAVANFTNLIKGVCHVLCYFSHKTVHKNAVMKFVY